LIFLLDLNAAQSPIERIRRTASGKPSNPQFGCMLHIRNRLVAKSQHFAAQGDRRDLLT
jgi:hypothetical protein